jgi:hypothetical protein
MCAMFLIPTSSQSSTLTEFLLYLMQKNHPKGFRLSHCGTLAVAYPPVPMVGRIALTLRSDERDVNSNSDIKPY